jgi:hypothetical protein
MRYEQQFDRLTQFFGISFSRRVAVAVLAMAGAMGIISPLALDEAAKIKSIRKARPRTHGRCRT